MVLLSNHLVYMIALLNYTYNCLNVHSWHGFVVQSFGIDDYVYVLHKFVQLCH